MVGPAARPVLAGGAEPTRPTKRARLAEALRKAGQKAAVITLPDSLCWLLNVRGADTIISQGRSRKAKNGDFYASLENAYGVPAGVLLAIHGMETGFGGFMGDTNVVSAIATLTYDCRRSDFFRPHLK